ncbi:MAG: hypothetical protein HY896_00785 [Deltaproteobacteria bacterium]|nr:hypothetical protein [Deltaproteobacteria bacterium]
MQARIRDDVPLAGKQAACVSCHRRSGMGSIEGRTIARPVTGTALYRPSELYARGPFQSLRNGAGKWPAYTDETLARAIREGIDPSERILGPAMPRYRLGDGDLRFLISYLKSMSVSVAPGVTEETIRFATVVDGRTDPAKRKAMLDVLRTYFADIGGDPRNILRKGKLPGLAGAKQFGAFRKWELDVWEMSGHEAAWEAQLEEHYRARPVFALIGGIAENGWGPVHRFCEKYEVPSLFPNVVLPVVSETNYYSFYFSRGMALEAEALARHLGGERESMREGTIVQVYRSDEAGTISAEAFRSALRKNNVAGLRDRRIGENEALTPAFWAGVTASDRPYAVVLWLRAAGPGGLGLPDEPAVLPERIYLSSGLTGGRNIPVPESLRDRVHLLHSFTQPLDEERRMARSRAWLRSRGMGRAEERLQANTLFAAALAMEALDHLLGNFSRDYFIEWIEHQAEDALTPSAYPRMALGPGQRFASKGCYILGYSKDAKDWVTPVGGWIVPDR